MEIKVSRSVPVNIITTMSHLHTSDKLNAASFETALYIGFIFFLYYFIKENLATTIFVFS